MATVTLHQFPYSHFNEKVRWALAHKQIVHERKSYLPGPHIPAIRKLSGQTATPVLAWNDQVITGSAAIIEFLEKQVPKPALFPTDAAEREKALDLCRWLDEEVGPANRTVLFAELIDDANYMTGMFSNGRPLPVRWLYRFTFPMARGLIASANGVNPDNLERCLRITATALDRIADAVEPTGYLVGNSFTVADLTAAALFAPLAAPDHPDMARPRPVPPGVQSVIEQYSNHPTVRWVNSMYEHHRP
ncbi:MAG: glutathione S-transferase [Proteobacteria bacterium]|nr:glutathione S-transferase [Pseudomonadota bacterium]